MIGKLAIARPMGWKFVTSVIVGVPTCEQGASNLEPGGLYVPVDVWKSSDKLTQSEEYNIWFTRKNDERCFRAADFHNEHTELP
jgi:hypothetical protein